MPIPPERLERYRDFVDPEHTGTPYDPRQGLEKLLGVLSPDPEGITLAAMGDNWLGTSYQLRSRLFDWLKELRLSPKIWPVSISSTWSYCEKVNRVGETIDGALVNLGAVVKKAEDPLQILYSRSIAGTELAIPLVQHAVAFVSRAREYAKEEELAGKKKHKFDSMWRILGSVHSRTAQRRPLLVFDVIDFLANNKGVHREKDLQNGLNTSSGRLSGILLPLANCGVIKYQSPMGEVRGEKIRGWSVVKLADRQALLGQDSYKIFRDIMGLKKRFLNRDLTIKLIDYLKEHPDDEYEYRKIAKKLSIKDIPVITILSSLIKLGILERPELGYKSGERQSSVSANDLTHIFYDLVCRQARDIAYTLSPLPLEPWGREAVAVYLQNYDEERSNVGPQGGEEVKRLLFDILAEQKRKGLKLSHIVDLFNDRSERELSSEAIGTHLRLLLASGKIEQPQPGYYRLPRKQK